MSELRDELFQSIRATRSKKPLHRKAPMRVKEDGETPYRSAMTLRNGGPRSMELRATPKRTEEWRHNR